MVGSRCELHACAVLLLAFIFLLFVAAMLYGLKKICDKVSYAVSEKIVSATAGSAFA